MSEDRPTSILTNSQREYLQGVEDSQPSNPREYNRRIRERIESGLLDLHILFENLSQEELRKTFGTDVAPRIDPQEQANGDTPTSTSTPVWVPGAIAFFLRGLDYGEEPIVEAFEHMGEEQPAFSAFTDAVENGVQQYLHEEKNYSANVSVTIELDDLGPTQEFIQEQTDKRD